MPKFDEFFVYTALLIEISQPQLFNFSKNVVSLWEHHITPLLALLGPMVRMALTHAVRRGLAASVYANWRCGDGGGGGGAE